MDNKILNNYLQKVESYLDQNEAINILKSIIQIDSRTNSKNENNRFVDLPTEASRRG